MVAVIKGPLPLVTAESVQEGFSGRVIRKPFPDLSSELDNEAFDGLLSRMIRAEQAPSFSIMLEYQAAERAFLISVNIASHRLRR
jgi:hypothetical protein